MFVSGTTGWFTALKPQETDVLLRRVFKLPEFSGFENEDSDGVDRRLYCPENRLQELVSFDPMLGRLCVVSGEVHKFSIVDVQ